MGRTGEIYLDVLGGKTTRGVVSHRYASGIAVGIAIGEGEVGSGAAKTPMGTTRGRWWGQGVG